ncbi:MAG: hypothetical protein HYU81_02935 [Candidatus Brennerbacteria bacterium]|nr:hypothetical protein [Candidatus Brennerbacteria bacterium]
MEIVSGAALGPRRGFGGQAPPFRPPAGGFTGAFLATSLSKSESDLDQFKNTAQN